MKHSDLEAVGSDFVRHSDRGFPIFINKSVILLCFKDRWNRVLN